MAKVLLFLPKLICNIFLTIAKAVGSFFVALAKEIADIFVTFFKGDWKTKLSYLIMGFGCFARGKFLRGLAFLLLQVVFICFMLFYGVGLLEKLSFKGLVPTHTEPGKPVVIGGIEFVEDVTVYGDNNLKIMIAGVLTVLVCVCFVIAWRMNIRQSKTIEDALAAGKRLPTGKQDLRSLTDENFHVTVLALPVLGIVLFTLVPIIIMIMIAFTNYDYNHTPPTKLFEWVGLDNINSLLSMSGGSSLPTTFLKVLGWTLVWALFATFSNYFLGMLVAMLINKKGIKLKKMWRTLLVTTIAIPQFISLLYVSKMFADNGLVNLALKEGGLIETSIPFWSDATMAKIMVVLVNIWVGIPYLMLITTGVLMNIPVELYEAARIDGAGPVQQFFRITLPHVLFVTGPYLLTSFIANMNNFNVIYLLTSGSPFSLPNSAGETDLLITWLYRLTVTNNDYKLAAVIGIMVFFVVSVLSLIVYNAMPSVKNEEDYQG